jgi:diguanylate cyclase
MEQKLTPFELARQTLMQLAKSKSPPTPDNFRRVYDEIAGVESHDSNAILSKSLEKVLLGLGKDKPKLVGAAQKISVSVKKQDVSSLEEQLRQLISAEGAENAGVNWAALLRYLLKQLDDTHPSVTSSQKKESLNRLIANFSNDVGQLGQRIQTLIASWGEGKPVNEAPASVGLNADEDRAPTNIQVQQPLVSNQEDEAKLAVVWRDLLIRTLNLVVLPQFSEAPAALERVQALITHANDLHTIEEVNKLSEALKSTLLRVEMQADTQHRMQGALVQMLRLLVTSMGELTIEDTWLQGQILIIQDIIAKPLKIDDVYNAESSLKELLYKQSSIRPSLLVAKDSLKSMMNTFVSGLTDITESTGSYHAKVSHYQGIIAETDDVAQLNAVLQSLVSDIAAMSADAQKSHHSFQESQQEVAEAEKKINELTVKLDYISEVAHQDFLTGALNRRGMDEAIEREFSRADRHSVPISIAMIDIDHFKKINDTMGHSTGDIALAHLAKVVKSVIRSTDVLARYGGEEFVVLLPGSKQDDAVNVVSGIQRALTKNFFMHNNGSVLITFSAGVAERITGEEFDSILPRADAALYQAKQNGRNRVVGAVFPSDDNTNLIDQ